MKYKFPADLLSSVAESIVREDQFGSFWLTGARNLTALRRDDIFEVDIMLTTIDWQHWKKFHESNYSDQSNASSW